MATPLGNIYYTDEEMVAQSDTELLESIVESLVVEFDQERYEKFLYAGSVSPKATRRFRKVSQETPLSLSLSEESSDEDRRQTFKKARHPSSMARNKKASKVTHGQDKLIIHLAHGHTLSTRGPSTPRQRKRNADRQLRRKARRVEAALRREAMEKMEESLQECEARETNVSL